MPKYGGRGIQILISWSQKEVANLNFYEQELLEDPAITSAIDEETEFNALVVCGFSLSKWCSFWLSLTLHLCGLCCLIRRRKKLRSLIHSWVKDNPIFTFLQQSCPSSQDPPMFCFYVFVCMLKKEATFCNFFLNADQKLPNMKLVFFLWNVPSWSVCISTSIWG